jgi:predicted kinase
MEKMKAILFDIDGTLADIEHRIHLLPDWPKFFAQMHDDVGIEPIIDLAQLLAGGMKTFPLTYKLLIVTARPDTWREVTETWLKKWLIPYDALYMRKEGDYRQDSIVKGDLLQQIIDDGYTPTLVIDDRPEVVEMWRSYGLACLQCASNEIKLKHDGKQFLDLLVGPAGAGKSTYVAKNYYDAWDVISTDALRGHYGWGHTPDDLAKTWNYAHSLMKARLENHIYTVFDATNIKRNDRMKLLRYVPRGQYVRYIVIDRPLDVKLRDRGWRPEELVLKHHRTMQRELPNILAGDHLPNVVVIDRRS